MTADRLNLRISGALGVWICHVDLRRFDVITGGTWGGDG